MWGRNWSRKEAGLLWLIWHDVVAVNQWQMRISGGMDNECLVCPRRSEETVLRRFWECASAMRYLHHEYANSTKGSSRPLAAANMETWYLL